jgi:hypothetical protein
MDQYRDLGMRKNLDRLAAKDDRRNAVAAMRRHDNQVTAFRPGGIDDRTVGMLMLDLDHFACDARRLRVSVVKIWKGGKTVSAVVLAPIRSAKAIPCWTAFPGEFWSVRCYQDVGIHHPLLRHDLDAQRAQDLTSPSRLGFDCKS